MGIHVRMGSDGEDGFSTLAVGINDKHSGHPTVSMVYGKMDKSEGARHLTRSGGAKPAEKVLEDFAEHRCTQDMSYQKLGLHAGRVAVHGIFATKEQHELNEQALVAAVRALGYKVEKVTVEAAPKIAPAQGEAPKSPTQAPQANAPKSQQGPQPSAPSGGSKAPQGQSGNVNQGKEGKKG